MAAQLERHSFDEQTLGDLKTAKDRVRFLLERYPATRGNDSYLCWLYLKAFAQLNLPYLEFEKFYSFNFETITRVRRLIQAKGELLPSDSAVLARRRKEEAFHHVINQV
jgi:hypothetical protein